jgi:hypothetical protein
MQLKPLDRSIIAQQLLDSCPDECLEDHAIVAQAIRDGHKMEDILKMRELRGWPETYHWLKTVTRS